MDERVRYINIRIISPLHIQEKEAWFIVSSEIRRLFGTVGAADVGLFLSYYDEENQGGIYRASHKFIDRVRTVLCFIHIRQNTPLFIFSENVSGSLKKAKTLLKKPKNIKRYQYLKELLYQKKSTFVGNNQKTMLQ
ncbi:MAG: Rpp14/Pop5 family protein [Candidatus Hodarchaeota archaeon]